MPHANYEKTIEILVCFFTTLDLIWPEFCPSKDRTHFTYFFKNRNFMAPFYGCVSTTSRPEPLQGGSLLFTTKSPEILTLSTSEG